MDGIFFVSHICSRRWLKWLTCDYYSKYRCKKTIINLCENVEKMLVCLGKIIQHREQVKMAKEW